MSKQKPTFSLKDVPNALIGIFGIRTEKEVPFVVIKKEGAFEIREIESHIELANQRTGTRTNAANKSFRDLLAFIQGNNKPRKKYSMTAPVWQEAVAQGWKTSFYLNENLSERPIPEDDHVFFEDKEKQRFATYRFTGLPTHKRIFDSLAILRQWMKKERLKSNSSYRIALYDPPFTVPFLRRNEIQILIVES